MLHLYNAVAVAPFVEVGYWIWHVRTGFLTQCVQVFGPILPIVKFKTDQEAVELANDCPFGLGSSVFSKSQVRSAYVEGIRNHLWVQTF